MPESPKKPASREKLLSAAVELFIEKGFPAVSVRDIATRAELSTGLLYNYFDYKEHPLYEIISISLEYLKPLFTADTKPKPGKILGLPGRTLFLLKTSAGPVLDSTHRQSVQVELVKPLITDFRLQRKQCLNLQVIARHT